MSTIQISAKSASHVVRRRALSRFLTALVTILSPDGREEAIRGTSTLDLILTKKKK